MALNTEHTPNLDELIEIAEKILIETRHRRSIGLPSRHDCANPGAGVGF